MNVAPLGDGRLRVRFCFSTKIIFKLTIDISMCIIILEVKYLIKSMTDLSNVKIVKKKSLFHPEMIRSPLFRFKETKNTG